MALACSPATAAPDDIQAWKKPLPGASAILGDDGVGDNMATICDTADHYRDWKDWGRAVGCTRLPHGLHVIVEGVLCEPSEDEIPGITNCVSLAKIQIPAQHFTGYLALMGELHPDVPTGTSVLLKFTGNAKHRLAPSQDAGLDTGSDLDEGTAAKVLQYDPFGHRELYVMVMNGVQAGQSGWVFGFEAIGDDGIPVNQFTQSLLVVPIQP